MRIDIALCDWLITLLESAPEGLKRPTHNITAAFTLSPESWASTCCAGLPGNQVLYAVSVRRLIDHGSV